MKGSLSEATRSARSLAEYYTSYASYLSQMLNQIDPASVEAVGEVFLNARLADKTIYFVGNGGSAATASHFSQDLAEVGHKINARGFKSLSLTDNTAYITAAANDYGYEAIFVTQMTNLFADGDVLVAISASGNSPNVVKAAEFAKQRNGTTVALVGFDGGQLARISDHVIWIPTPKGEYGPVEDAHMILDHVITNYLMTCLKIAELPP